MPNFFDRLSPSATVPLLDAIFEAQGADYALIDADMRYLHVSDTQAKRAHLPASLHIGKLVSDIMEPERWEQTRPHLEAALHGTGTYHKPHTGREPSPTPHARASFIPLRLPPAFSPLVALIVEQESALAKAQVDLKKIAAANEQNHYAFMRDVLLSVTDERFFLCRERGDLPPPAPPFEQRAPVSLTAQGGVRELRKWAEAAAYTVGIPPSDWFDMENAVGEAALNTFIHASGGTGRVGVNSETGTLQVQIVDNGSGIATENLPRAVLLKGFSTAGTMGYGLKIMVQTCDRLWLLTGANGTTIVLEKDKEPPTRFG